MYQQYYKSDFKLIMKRYTYDPKATDEAEKLTPVPWPEDIDWRLKLATPHSAKPYEASCRGGVTKNCTKTEDGGILVALDNHGLACGELRYEFHFELPDPVMASGIADLYKPGSTGIMLTTDASCECGGLVDVAVVTPMYKGDKGEPFRYSDFTPEQLEDLRRPAVEAAVEAAKAVEALENTVDVAEDLRAKAEEARETAETQREANEKVRQNAETQRESLFNDAHDRALAAIEAANAAVASATAAATAASDAADKCAEMIEAFETMRNEFLSRSYLLMEN